MNVIKASLLVLTLTGLYGCTAFNLLANNSIKSPTFKYKSYTIGDPRKDYLPVDLIIDVKNPNEIGLKNTYVKYELIIKGKRFAQGKDIKLDLPPLTKKQIIIPIELHYKNTLKAGGYIAEKILSGKKKFKIQANIMVYGSPTIYDENQVGESFPFSIEARKKLKIKIPRDKIEDSLDGLPRDYYRAAMAAADAEEEMKKIRKLEKSLKNIGKLF
ncbi:MAG: hypothetical protein COA78_25620 [Blastopirellula sp.]|nr:MAG: hypothetical protein COA78_25620 [Blastopirellula sp.]